MVVSPTSEAFWLGIAFLADIAAAFFEPFFVKENRSK
jgi:hypothetical protein